MSGIRLADHRSPLAALNGENSRAKSRLSVKIARLATRANDNGAAVLLADALLRQARVTADGRPAGRAAEVLKSVLKENPGHYEATRMLGAVYLSQHRFREALDIALRARNQRPDDAWTYGIIGDAYLELGEYEKAFDAFDTMVTRRPSPAAYARVAYARELQGQSGRGTRGHAHGCRIDLCLAKTGRCGSESRRPCPDVVVSSAWIAPSDGGRVYVRAAACVCASHATRDGVRQAARRS